jgi:FkbM family methyltransferase
VAFEPNNVSFEILSRTTKTDDLFKFNAHNYALGAKSGEAELHSDEDRATASLLPFEADYPHSSPLEARLVRVETLDAFMTGANEDSAYRLALLKVDTQGNDLAVLQGGLETILKHKPIIQVEFIYIPLYQGQCSPAEITEFLQFVGYKLFTLECLHVTTEGQLAFCDAIFVHRDVDLPITHEFGRIDDSGSFESQLQTLTEICAERLEVINVLDAEVTRLRSVIAA